MMYAIRCRYRALGGWGLFAVVCGFAASAMLACTAITGYNAYAALAAIWGVLFNLAYIELTYRIDEAQRLTRDRDEWKRLAFDGSLHVAQVTIAYPPVEEP